MKPRIALVLALCLIALGSLALAPSPVLAAGSVWIVNGSFFDDAQCNAIKLRCKTIQAAITGAADGDTVLVMPGTYAEPTVTLGAKSNFSLVGSANSRPIIVNGLNLGTQTNLTLRNLIIRKTGDTGMIVQGSGVTGFTMDHVQVDGESVIGPTTRHGVGNGFYNGDISITYSEFLNIDGWVAFDARSGSGGPTDGATMNNVVFSHNVLRNTRGHINFRATISTPTPSVIITDNLVELGGSATNSFGGIIKVFYATNVVFTRNTIKDVGTSGYNPGGEAPYGAGFMPRGVVTMTVTNNVFGNNNQAIAIEPRNGNPGGFPDGVLPNGVISGNTFTGNTYAVYIPATLHPTSNFAGLVITGNNFTGNVTEAVHNGYAAGTAQAAGNWWGCINGANGGSGCDAVSTYVNTAPNAVALVSSTTASTHEIGDVGTFQTNITANGIYGIQLRVTRDPSILSFASGAYHDVGGFFWDVLANEFTPLGTPPEPDHRLAGSMSAEYHPTAVDLTNANVATWNYTCDGVGTSSITYNTAAAELGTKLANISGFEIPAAFTGDSITCVTATGSVDGYIKLQGRLGTASSPAGWNGANVTLTCLSGGCVGYGPYVMTTDATGHYQLVESGPGDGIVPGTYSATVIRRAYLGATRSSNVTVTASTTTIDDSNNAPTLKGGDVNDSGEIDSTDLGNIGLVFGTAITPDTGADVNGDGFVNIFDLVLAGGNFGATTSVW